MMFIFINVDSSNIIHTFVVDYLVSVAIEPHILLSHRHRLGRFLGSFQGHHGR